PDLAPDLADLIRLASIRTPVLVDDRIADHSLDRLLEKGADVDFAVRESLGEGQLDFLLEVVQGVLSPQLVGIANGLPDLGRRQLFDGGLQLLVDLGGGNLPLGLAQGASE